MEGLILNEDSKYVTYLEPIFDALGPIAENLNWRISYMEIGGTYSFETHLRNNFDYWISGKDLASELRNHPNNQWIWGLLQGYSSNILYEEIAEEPLVDITEDPIIWTNPVSLRSPKAEIEIEAFDSTLTVVITSSDNILQMLMGAFPNYTLLSEYNKKKN